MLAAVSIIKSTNVSMLGSEPLNSASVCIKGHSLIPDNLVVVLSMGRSPT